MAAAAPPRLLGPPEIHRAAAPRLLGPPPPPPPAPTGNPFIDLMDASFNNKSAPLPPMGLTENGSATFTASGNACLDFFFLVVPDTQAKTLNSLLEAAWAHDPLTALKLVCHLRGVRGTGKSDRKGFYAAALWLHRHHPKSLALNAAEIAEFGYLKDLPEILHRLVAPGTRKRVPTEEVAKSRAGTARIMRSYGCRPKISRSGTDEKTKKAKSCKKCRCKVCRCMKRTLKRKLAKLAKQEVENRFGGYGGGRVQGYGSGRGYDRREPRYGGSGRSVQKVGQRRQRESTEERIAAELAKVKIQVEEAANLRHEKRAKRANVAVNRYARDPDYRLLHDKTSEVFATLLSSDLEMLKAGDMKHFSLAAKWCPSLNSSYDRSTLLCESIARRMFPRDLAEYSAVEDQHYAYRVRDRLRKEVLVPLRKALKLPEVYMCAKQWGALPYSRVASIAMKNYKEIFFTHDKERFSEFLGQVKKGKAKIAAGALLPHEVVTSAMAGQDDEVAELQWKRMVSDLLEIGKLSNCIAVCDVSGSMDGTPMDVCIALGMLLAELSEEPWKGRVITFSANPQLHYIKGESLKEKAEFVKRMEWGMNTDFQKVFDQILKVAVEGKLAPEKMIKRVFVFSDMEFDLATGRSGSYPYYRNAWETDYEVICKKYEASGYGSVVPEIVFWNLRDSRSTPVTAQQKGVALVSGFSKNMVKLFLKGEAIPSPQAVMEAAIAGEEYKKLVVFD